MSYRYSPLIVKDRAHLFAPLERGEMCVWTPTQEDLMHTQFRLRETLANARNYPNVVPWLTEWARRIRLVVDGGRIVTEVVSTQRVKPARALAGKQQDPDPIGLPRAVLTGSPTPLSDISFDISADEIVAKLRKWRRGLLPRTPEAAPDVLSMTNNRTSAEELLKAAKELEIEGYGIYAAHPYLTPLNAGWIITYLGDPERLPFDEEYIQAAPILEKESQGPSGFDLLTDGDRHA